MMFIEALIKFFCQLQNCRQQRRQIGLGLNHYPNWDYDRCYSSNKAAGRGSKKAGDVN